MNPRIAAISDQHRSLPEVPAVNAQRPNVGGRGVFGHIHEAGGSRSRLARAELAKVSKSTSTTGPAREATAFEPTVFELEP